MNAQSKQLRRSLLVCGVCSLLLVACDKEETVRGQETKTPMPFQEAFFTKLSSPLTNDLIYSKAVYLQRNSVIQCFDVANSGDVYYVQIAGSDQHQLLVIKGAPNQQNPTESMTLEYFGHGTNMAIEEQGSETYVWINSHGNKGGDGAYGGSQTFSRVKFENGKKVQNAAGDIFHLNGARNIHPALCVEKDILGVTYSGTTSGVTYRTFAAYRLSEALKLPLTEMTLDLIKYGGESTGTVKEITEAMVVQAKELSQLTPLYKFSISEGYFDKGGMVGAFSNQGFDISENFVYYYEGIGNDNKADVTSEAYVSVLDKNGNLSGRQKVEAIYDRAALSQQGLADRGYMEAEGIKVKNGKLYLGFASRLMNGGIDERRANILVYTNN